MADRYGTRYDKYTSSFSGTDMNVSFVFPGAAPISIGTATNINYSIYRQLAHVRTLGRISSKGYARGGRTCAGTIVFTVVKESFVEDVRSRVGYLGDFKTLKPDELPPFDIILTFGNEFGQTASLVIYGVSFTDETKTLSIEDIFTENVLTFMARDIRHMKGDAKKLTYGNSKFRGSDEILGKFKLSDLVATAEAAERKKRLEEIERSKAARWKEPVLSAPSSAASSSAGGSSNSSSGSTNNNSSDTLMVMVKDNSGKLVSGASVWFANEKGAKISGTTDSKGVWKKTVTLGNTYTVHAKKSGYSEGSVNHKTSKSTSAGTVVITINKVSTPSGGADPEARVTVKNVDFASPAAYTGSQNGTLRVKTRWKNGEGPAIKLTNMYGQALSGVRVAWQYNVRNYDDCPLLKKVIFKLNWPRKKEYYGYSYTNSNGVASAPVIDIDGLFDGANLDITAEPSVSKDSPDTMVAKSKFKTFSFYKNDGGL